MGFLRPSATTMHREVAMWLAAIFPVQAKAETRFPSVRDHGLRVTVTEFYPQFLWNACG